ncbi:hypothetical protein [Flavobacterium sp. XS2P39]|uniref:hypothetical protein n=1 Tax=Flavobacterium sp. XS2P39 TaxID=3401725 RepID=UPI003AAA9734
MEKNYKEAIKSKYEKEKTGIHSSFLVNPSPARLRMLCEMIFKENKSSDDLYSFNAFFGFEFNPDNMGKLRNQVDRFKPIGSFLKGKTELTDITAVNMAAILVDFNPRPIQRFLKETKATIVLTEEQPGYSILDTVGYTSQEERNETSPARTIAIFDNTIKAKASPLAILAQIQNKTISVKQIGKILMLLLVFLVSGYGVKEFISPKKDCIQWQNDHYEVVDCTIAGIGVLNEIKPTTAEELKLKKIEVTLQTSFFQKNKAIVWYCKNNGKLEYFNTAGFHPENGKPLKPISQYIIDKYIKK